MRAPSLWLVLVACFAILSPSPQGVSAEETASPPESSASASKPEEKLYRPSSTRVAVLPFLNEIPGQDGPEEQEACRQAEQWIAEAFGKARFRVLTPDALKECLEGLEADLSDPEERNRETFQAIATCVGADLVVSGGLREHSAGLTSTFCFARKVAISTVSIRVYDAADQCYRVDSVQSATKKSSVFANLERARTLRFSALETAISTSLEEFLKPYSVKSSSRGKE